jgi:hypothetical protein
MAMIRLVGNEMRRAMHRRVVWALIALALVGVALLGVIAFADSSGKSVAELELGDAHPALMADWWMAGTADGILVIAALPLLIGALFGGASVVGAEWRAGTVTTILTWEPRRLRLHVARTLACVLLATAIAFVLQAVFLAATLPAVLAHGTTAGVDAAWWWALLGAMARIALVTGAAACISASLATIGRGTAFALGVAFAWLAVAEGLVRGLKPGLQHLLLGDNLTLVLTWGQLEGAEYARSGLAALLTGLTYLAIVGGAGTLAFTRRDVAGLS